MKDKIIEQLKKRRLLVAVSVLFFVLVGTILYTTFSEKTTSSIWDGTIAKKFSSGDGTIKNPYIINSGSELAYFFTLINSEESVQYYDRSYEIRNNINLNGLDFSFAKFDKPFSGTLNGNGFTIYNFTINESYLNDVGDELNYSLFDSLFNANIKNINFEDITINVDSVSESKEEIKEEKTEEKEAEFKVEPKIEETEKSEPIAMLIAENIDLDDDDTAVSSSGNTIDEEETPKEEPQIEEPKEEPKTEEPKEDEPSVVDNKDDDKPDITKEENSVVEPTDGDSTDGEESKEKVEIQKINVSLFKDVEHSNITNISLKNVKLNIKEKDLEVNTSLFILNDNEENNIKNIAIANGKSNIVSPLLIKNYNNSTLTNIIYSSGVLPIIDNYEVKDSDTIYGYIVSDNKIIFNNNYSTKAMIDMLNNGYELKWKLQDNAFKIQNNGKNDSAKPKKSRSLSANAPSGHASGTEGTIVYINDYAADEYYYKGLNYTYSSNGTIPTTVNKNIYNESNLVYTEIHYYGTDLAGRYTGAVSNSENYNQYVYYKVFPVNNNGTSNDNSDDYIEFDLIDNPFSKLPNQKFFQGWATDYPGVVTSLDTDIYVRSAKVPVNYGGDTPANININFHAVWGYGKERNYATSWSNTFSYLDSAGFHAISTATYTHNVSGYYTSARINNRRYFPYGALDQHGNSIYNQQCNAGNGNYCYYYIAASGNWSSRTTYYALVNGTMTPSTVPETLNYTSEIPDNESTAGYYRYVNLPRYTSLVGYFDSNGNTITSGTCSQNAGCNYYELIQYYDENNQPEVFTPGNIIYYKTTRDTNVVLLTSNLTSIWGSSQNKPFTFTAQYGNTNNYSNYYWDTRSLQMYMRADTRIENMRIRGVARITDDTTPAVEGGRWDYSDAPGANSIYSNYHNVKIGRGIGTYSNTTVSLDYIIGGNMTAVSSANTAKYTFIVESGVYNNLGLTTTGANSNYLSSFTSYVDAYGTFGNDFDRVTETNPMTTSKLEVIYCLSGSWFGTIRGANITTIMLHTNIKSGRYGTDKADYAAGVYVGGRNSGSHYSPREVLVEGGYIYNLIGGPLSRTDIKSYNDSYIYMKGGYVDIIIGGAGRSETYGNRIIQVTGGRVNYAVFGGSNGVEGDDSQYTSTVDGDSYVYIGGNAVIGDPALVQSNAVESESLVEAGSVFGIGNGRSGYSSIGTVNNSNVIIDEDAVVNKNVYGGGNFGATGQNGSNQTYATKIIIHGGDIKGSVYGGGNNNGAGKTNNTCNINITMDDGIVRGSVYGGSRTKGRIYGSTTVNITSGKVSTDVYGGGEGGYEDNTAYGTFVSGNVDVTIGNNSTGPTIGGSVYGGSAFGSVNCTATNPNANNNTVNVTVNNGTITNSVFGGAKGSSTRTPYIPGQITVDINGGTITNVFGGFDEAGKPTKNPVVYIDGGTITNVYGGGNKTSVDNTHIYMRDGTVTTMYGGSNQAGTVLTTTVDVSGGTTSTIFGGNNQGGTCNSTTVNVTGGRINSAVYGGGNLVNTGTTTVNIYNSPYTIPNIYGGGNQAGATTTTVNLEKRSGSNNVVVTNVYGGSNQSGNVTTTNVNIKKGTVTSAYGGGNSVGVTTSNITVYNESTISVTNLYGGSNQQGTVGTSNVIVNGGTVGTAYGSNNDGGSTTDANVTINNGTITNAVFGGGNMAQATNTHVTINNGTVPLIYGGGNQAQVTGSTNVEVVNAAATITAVYGGGNQAGANITNVNINPTNDNLHVTSVFGGSNQSGIVAEANVEINHGTIASVFGGNNAGGSTTETNVTVNAGVLTDVYGGGNQAVAGDTNVTIEDGTITNVYGGGNQAAADDAIVIVNDGTITNVYGGGNQAAVTSATTTINDGTVNTLYGGGNAANVTGNAAVNMLGGSVTTNLYGGGNQGSVNGSTTVVIDDATIGGSAFAGGNGTTAAVNGSTELKIFGATITENAYGGGNNGTVSGNTTVYINDSSIHGSAYAGGNGSTATVFGNTTITVGGTTEVGTSSCTILSRCSVFGGGNAATTGAEATNNSTSSVKIAGATIHGNVYGGANTSKVFGSANVNIGNDVTTTQEITAGNVVIHGTVFGGGEANASGSDEYDWTFVSVTRGITVNINGANRSDFRILGSIFGSGNASTAAGTSTVTIKNYGTFASPKNNVSIQRTNVLTIDNSAIHLAGATDRENEYSDVLFSLSRIDRLDLKNNSSIFLDTGANLLKEFRSLDSTGALVEVDIDTENETIDLDTDNRVYMLADKKLNIAKNQNVTDYGEVSGMSFFGMYRVNNNGTINTGIYNRHNFNDTLDWGGVFDNVSSYVLGLHKTNHDITKDGFYTNYIDEATSKNKINYIEPTPPTGPLYMWTIGEGVIEYEVDLSASKYSTLGTAELSLIDFTNPNTSFEILGFDYSELDSEVQLVEKTNIKKIADTSNEADTKLGLSMETSNSGWLVNGYTSFLSRANNNIIGTTHYAGGNSAGAPSVLFYLHHSKNIATPGDIGKVRIQLMSIRQVDALTKETKRLIITANLTRTLIDTVNYEGALTAGRKYDLFTSTVTNITSKSAISVYYSLFNAGASIYRTGYHRALVSNYTFPLNTKITMIDLSKYTPDYYYHVINQADVNRAEQILNNAGEVAYDLSMFEVMGALNSGVYYNDVSKNTEYCSSGNYCNEDFIFIIDFGDTEIEDDAINNKLLMEIRSADDNTIYSVLAPQHENLMYNIYEGRDAVIDISGTINKNKIYSGETFIADLHIDYTQSTVGSATIYDTHYFDSKLGIKLSLINSNNEVVKGLSMLGLYYVIDEQNYYPGIDGTARVKVAEKVDSAEKWVIINTGTSSIASGNYKLRVETFGSPDGIYYGLNASDYIDFNIEIVNEIYGLNFTTTADQMMIDAATGTTTSGSDRIVYSIRYNSGLTTPSIAFKMYRRKYDTEYDTNYELVDASDYFDNAFVSGHETNEYTIIATPTDNSTFTFMLKDNLMSGTYRMQFILYDSNSVIGTIERYIIIK